MKDCYSHYETALATCVSGFRPNKNPESFKTYLWLEPVFRKLWSIYDEYIAYMDDAELHNDLPWIYTERSIVGHLTAAAYLANRVALEEFQQPKEDGQAGRADWWMGTNDRSGREIYAETKFKPISSDASTWKSLQSTLGDAENQLIGYGFHHQRGQCEHIAMCFVQPYFPVTDDRKKIAEHYERWCGDGVECPKGVDYFTGYWLKSLEGRRVPSRDGTGDVYCPGLFIYCHEVQPKR